MNSFTSTQPWRLPSAVSFLLAATLPLASLAAEETVTADFSAGKKVYSTTCFVCHGKDGKGAIPGVPDMTGKKSRLFQDDATLLKHAREGYQSKGSPMAMPPKGGNPKLTDADLKNVIAYMKANFLPQK